MKIGILSDTHNELNRTQVAINQLIETGVEILIHCGDLSSPEIVALCSIRPFYFVFGNHDSDTVPYLTRAAEQHGSHCLGWGGELTVAEKRIAVVHGHLTMDLKPLLDTEPDYLLSGHSHIAGDWMQGSIRRINPGALFRAEEYSVAVLDLSTDKVEFFSIPE